MRFLSRLVQISPCFSACMPAIALSCRTARPHNISPFEPNSAIDAEAEREPSTCPRLTAGQGEAAFFLAFCSLVAKTGGRSSMHRALAPC